VEIGCWDREHPKRRVGTTALRFSVLSILATITINRFVVKKHGGEAAPS
jgi:hypothetical protein